MCIHNNNTNDNNNYRITYLYICIYVCMCVYIYIYIVGSSWRRVRKEAPRTSFINGCYHHFNNIRFQQTQIINDCSAAHVVI